MQFIAQQQKSNVVNNIQSDCPVSHNSALSWGIKNSPVLFGLVFAKCLSTKSTFEGRQFPGDTSSFGSAYFLQLSISFNSGAGHSSHTPQEKHSPVPVSVVPAPVLIPIPSRRFRLSPSQLHDQRPKPTYSYIEDESVSVEISVSLSCC